MMRLLKGFLLVLGLAIVVLAGVITFGTSQPPPPLGSIANPFKTVDFSDLPKVETLASGNASPIAYRSYVPAEVREAVIVLHGSSASSSSLHPLGKAFAARGLAVYAPDIRGHGETGRRGDVDYAGQPDDDVKRMIAHVRAKHPGARVTLMGFSLGAGLALRNAGNANGALIDRVVLLAPALGPSAPTMKPRDDDPWARPHIPRIVALSILNRVGIRAFDGLEAIAYAVPPGSEKIQTGRYSWRLLNSLFPADYRQSLRSVAKPLFVLVGEKDELFRVDQFAPAIKAEKPDATVTIVPGLDHIHLSLDPKAFEAILANFN